MTAMPRKIATGYSQIFGLVWLVLFLLISYGHATGFFCPNGEQYERHLNELLNDNDFIFSGTVGNVTDDGRFIVIRIKSLFKGVWKNPDITLLANQPFESSSLSFIPLSDTKKDTTRWLLPQRSQVGCFAYGPTELRQRDSRVFFARVYGFSVLLQTHIQLTKFILMKLRILTLTPKAKPLIYRVLGIDHSAFQRKAGATLNVEQNASALPSWNVADKNKRV